jgi:hypothetical protein
VGVLVLVSWEATYFNLLVQFMDKGRLDHLWLLGGRGGADGWSAIAIAIRGGLRVAVGCLRAAVALVDGTAQRRGTHRRRGGGRHIHRIAGRRRQRQRRRRGKNWYAFVYVRGEVVRGAEIRGCCHVVGSMDDFCSA